MQNLKDLFDIFDKDNSGAIDASDLEQLMGNLGKDPVEA